MNGSFGKIHEFEFHINYFKLYPLKFYKLISNPYAHDALNL